MHYNFRPDKKKVVGHNIFRRKESDLHLMIFHSYIFSRRQAIHSEKGIAFFIFLFSHVDMFSIIANLQGSICDSRESLSKRKTMDFDKSTGGRI